MPNPESEAELTPPRFGRFIRWAVGGWSRRTTLAVAAFAAALLLATLVSWVVLSDGSTASAVVSLVLVLSALVLSLLVGPSVLLNSPGWSNEPEPGSTADRPYLGMTPVIAGFAGRPIVFRPTRSAWAGYRELAPIMAAARSLPDRMEALAKITALFVDDADQEYIRQQLTDTAGASLVDLMAAVDLATSGMHIQLIRAGHADLA